MAGGEVMRLKCEDGCGKCCEVGGTGMVLPVTRNEAEAVARALGRTIAPALTVPAPAFFPAVRVGGADCPAYAHGSCHAYAVRPLLCRDYRCNGEHHHIHTPESLAKMVDLTQRPEEVADLREFLPESIEQTLARHERIAFQFSGGMDSTAAVLLLRPFWDSMTVYFCDCGDSLPKTQSIIDHVAGMVPRSIMAPLHERMITDGITLIIRGQKDSDQNKSAFRSGMMVDGIEFLYPVQDWTDAQCFDFIREQGIDPQRFYAEGMHQSGHCATCTAWCEDDRAAFPRRKP